MNKFQGARQRSQGGADPPPQLTVRLQRVEADLHATWANGTAAALRSSSVAAAIDRQRECGVVMRADVLQALTEAVEAQSRTYEEALMPLAKVVGDERRNSAALITESLGTTDKSLRELSQRLEQTATVIQASRQAAAKASTQPALTARGAEEG